MGVLPARIWRDGGENGGNLFIFNKKTVRKRKKEVLLDKKLICVYNANGKGCDCVFGSGNLVPAHL